VCTPFFFISHFGPQTGHRQQELLQKISEGTLDPSTTTKPGGPEWNTKDTLQLMWNIHASEMFFFEDFEDTDLGTSYL
jgi:hypothetical protein